MKNRKKFEIFLVLLFESILSQDWQEHRYIRVACYYQYFVL